MDWIPIVQTGIKFLLLLVTTVSVLYAIYIKKKEVQYHIDNTINTDANLTIFTSREKMLTYLAAMYERAQPGEIVWGQSVSGNIYGDVSGKIIEAAARGVQFQVIFNSNAIKEIKTVFDKIKGATVALKSDNVVRIQGLADKEVVLAISTGKKYNAIVIRDKAIVQVLRSWFENRLLSPDANSNQ